MTEAQINYLAFREHKWKDFLLSLPLGSRNSFAFSTTQEIDSCKAVGTRLNSQGSESKVFRFSVNYKDRIADISVEDRIRLES